MQIITLLLVHTLPPPPPSTPPPSAALENVSHRRIATLVCVFRAADGLICCTAWQRERNYDHGDHTAIRIANNGTCAE